MTVVLPATLEDVERATCLYFSISADALHTGRRQSEAYARGVFCTVVRQSTRLSYPEIGEYVGMTGAGVCHNVQKIERIASADVPTRSDIVSIRRILMGEDVAPAGRGHVASERERDVA